MRKLNWPGGSDLSIQGISAGCSCLTQSLRTALPSVVSIEDPFDQDDWAAWSKFTANVGIDLVDHPSAGIWQKKPGVTMA